MAALVLTLSVLGIGAWFLVFGLCPLVLSSLVGGPWDLALGLWLCCLKLVGPGGPHHATTWHSLAGASCDTQCSLMPFQCSPNVHQMFPNVSQCFPMFPNVAWGWWVKVGHTMPQPGTILQEAIKAKPKSFCKKFTSANKALADRLLAAKKASAQALVEVGPNEAPGAVEPPAKKQKRFVWPQPEKEFLMQELTTLGLVFENGLFVVPVKETIVKILKKGRAAGMFEACCASCSHPSACENCYKRAKSHYNNVLKALRNDL